MPQVPVKYVCVLEKLNQVTHPFTPPSTPCCDDAVQDMDTQTNYFIAMEMDSGYWQVVAEEEAFEEMALWTPK